MANLRISRGLDYISSVYVCTIDLILDNHRKTCPQSRRTCRASLDRLPERGGEAEERSAERLKGPLMRTWASTGWPQPRTIPQTAGVATYEVVGLSLGSREGVRAAPHFRSGVKTVRSH